MLTLVLEFHTPSNSLSTIAPYRETTYASVQRRPSASPRLQLYPTIVTMLADLTPAGPPTSVCTSTATSIIPRSRSFHKLLALQKLRTKRPPTWLAQDADLAQLPQSVLRSVPQSALQPNADVPEESPSVPESPAESTPLGTQFVDLPVEIHEGIIDHLYGILGSTSSSAGGSVHVLKNWSNAMRHPRRRQLSDLTLVSPTWRRIIQERLYRHSELTCSA